MTITEMITKYKITLVEKNGQEMLNLSTKSKPTENQIAEIKNVKNEIIREIKRISTEKEADRIAEIEKIKTNIPGLDELKKTISTWNTYHDKCTAAIENSGIGYPSKPATAIEEVKSQYPVAAAYIKAQSYEAASNYQKSAAGEKATRAIENGEDYRRALYNMEQEWSKSVQENIWN